MSKADIRQVKNIDRVFSLNTSRILQKFTFAASEFNEDYRESLQKLVDDVQEDFQDTIVYTLGTNVAPKWAPHWESLVRPDASNKNKGSYYRRKTDYGMEEGSDEFFIGLSTRGAPRLNDTPLTDILEDILSPMNPDNAWNRVFGKPYVRFQGGKARLPQGITFNSKTGRFTARDEKGRFKKLDASIEGKKLVDFMEDLKIVYDFFPDVPRRMRDKDLTAKLADAYDSKYPTLGYKLKPGNAAHRPLIKPAITYFRRTRITEFLEREALS